MQLITSTSAAGGGDASAANQTTMITHLSEIEGAVETIEALDLMLGTDFSDVFGIASLVSATPAVKVEEQGTVVVDATGQGDVPVTLDSEVVAASQSGTWSVRLQDGAGTALTSTLVGADQSLDVNLTQSVALDVSAATVTVDLGANNDVTLATLPDTAAGDLASITTAVQLIDDPVATISATPLMRVAIFDASDSQITSFGGGTQYTEGDTDATIVGTAMLWEDAADTLRAVSATNALPVDIQDISAGTQTNDVKITLDGESVAVTGTFWQATQPVSLASVPSHNVTNAGTFAVQATLAAGATTIAKAEDVASADADVGVPALAVRKATPANTSGTDGDYEFLQMSAGRLWTSTTATSVVPGTTATSLGKAEDAGHTSGDTGVMALAVANTADANISGTTLDYTPISTDLTGAVRITGKIAHDGVDAGNPIKIGFKTKSPDGTTPGLVAENDRTDGLADLNGRQYVNIRHPQHWSFHSDGSSALTDSAVQAAPGASKQIVITEIIFSTGAATACNIFFEEGASKVLGPWYLEAVAGRGVIWRGHKYITANTAVTVTTSAAIAQSLDVQGYIIDV